MSLTREDLIETIERLAEESAQNVNAKNRELWEVKEEVRVLEREIRKLRTRKKSGGKRRQTDIDTVDAESSESDKGDDYEEDEDVEMKEEEEEEEEEEDDTVEIRNGIMRVKGARARTGFNITPDGSVGGDTNDEQAVEVVESEDEDDKEELRVARIGGDKSQVFRTAEYLNVHIPPMPKKFTLLSLPFKIVPLISISERGRHITGDPRKVARGVVESVWRSMHEAREKRKAAMKREHTNVPFRPHMGKCAWINAHLYQVYWGKEGPGVYACKTCHNKQRACFYFNTRSEEWEILPLPPQARPPENSDEYSEEGYYINHAPVHSSLRGMRNTWSSKPWHPPVVEVVDSPDRERGRRQGRPRPRHGRSRSP